MLQHQHKMWHCLACCFYIIRSYTRHCPNIDQIEHAKKPKRLPVVFTIEEVHKILLELRGIHHLVIALLYGTGIRINEGLHLHVKDIDFSY